MENTNKVRKLGRGLSSLIDTEVPVSVAPTVQNTEQNTNNSDPAGLREFMAVPVASIGPSRYQPRRSFDELSLSRLAASIVQSGLMQPVVVREVKDNTHSSVRYELVAGERRWRAAQLAGLTTIPALVRDLGDKDAAEWGLIENIQRDDLNPVDRAVALKRLSDEFSLTQQQLAERVGLDRSTVANFIRLTELEPEIATLLASGALTTGHGKALLSLPPGPKRVSTAQKAAAEHWTTRKLESTVAFEAVRKSGGRSTAPSDANSSAGLSQASPREAVLHDLERQISSHLGTKVAIKTDQKGTKGSLTIEFYGIDHFDGILSRLGIKPL